MKFCKMCCYNIAIASSNQLLSTGCCSCFCCCCQQVQCMMAPGGYRSFCATLMLGTACNVCAHQIHTYRWSLWWGVVGLRQVHTAGEGCRE